MLLSRWFASSEALWTEICTRSGTLSLSNSSLLAFVLTFMLTQFFMLKSAAVRILAWTHLTCDTHEAVMRLPARVRWCLSLAGCLLVGWSVGLLIFRPDAQVLPGGLSPHLSRWQDTLQSVTPLTHPAGHQMCVCVPVMHDCALFFSPEIFIHLIHLIIWWKPQVQSFIVWASSGGFQICRPKLTTPLTAPHLPLPTLRALVTSVLIILPPSSLVLPTNLSISFNRSRSPPPSSGLLLSGCTTRVHSFWLTNSSFYWTVVFKPWCIFTVSFWPCAVSECFSSI